MRGKHISTYVNIYFIVILTLVVGILGTLAGYESRKISRENVLKRLEIDLKVAENQLEFQDASNLTLLEEITYYEDIAPLITSRDSTALDQILQHANKQKNGYYLVIDKDGTILSSQDHPVGSKWELSYLLQYLKGSVNPLYTKEILSEDTIAAASPRFREQISISSEEYTIKTAMVQLILYPIYEDTQLVGALVGGYILNNSDNLASNYTKTVPDTYLTINTNEGLRICSNINVGTFSYLAGTKQEEELTATTNRGELWRGKLIMDKKNAFVVAKPLYNCKGDVIGNIGVGAPAFMFPDLGYKSVFIIAAICLLLLLVMALLLRYLNLMLLSPIYKLQKLSRFISQNKALPESIGWNDNFIPLEIHDLADDMVAMAQQLTEENIHLEEKVKDRTIHLQHTIKELESANSYKSQFLANISHELRTPLNSIIGFASLLEDELYGELNPKQKSYVSVIMDSSNHLLELINDVLQLIKLDKHVEKLSLEKISVTKLLQDTSESVEPMIRDKHLTLTLDMYPCVQEFYANWDNQKIRQVLLNLLSNSIKFSPEGGYIRIFLQQINSQEYILKVIDNGIGVEDELKEKVFLAFEQADSSFTRSYKGVGLGLAICKQFIEMHCGKIWLEDTPGGGATVCIRLPVDSSKP